MVSGPMWRFRTGLASQNFFRVVLVLAMGALTGACFQPLYGNRTIGTETRAVHENESTYIPIGSVHRLANPGKIPLELIEVQAGSYLGEDDIVRLTDEYGRQ